VGGAPAPAEPAAEGGAPADAGYIHATLTTAERPRLALKSFPDVVEGAAAAAEGLPLEVVSVMGVLRPEAMSAFGWEAHPAVALYGVVPLDDESLNDVAGASGIAISRSPVPAASADKALDTLFAGRGYPGHVAFLLRGRSFVILADDIDGAHAALARHVGPLLEETAASARRSSAAAAAGATAAARRPGVSRRWSLGASIGRKSSDSFADAAAAAVAAAASSSPPSEHVSGGFAIGSAGLQDEDVMDEAEQMIANMRVGHRVSARGGGVPSFQSGLKPW